MKEIGFASVVVFIACVAGNLLLFDRMLQRLRHLSPSEWDRLGKPGGFFWWPDEATFWQGNIARNRIARTAFFRKPAWVSSDPTIDAWWRKARTLWFAALAAWAVAMVCVLGLG